MRLVVLDRDGVINRDSADYIKSPEEWEPLEGSLDAIARLNRAGWQVVVASNQSGLRRGLFDVETLNGIHDRMQRLLAEVGGRVEAVFFCACLPDEGCACYKPEPGMLLDIAGRLRVSLDGVPVIGDSLRDVQAAHSAGARPILVRTGNGERTLAEDLHDLPEGTEVHTDLAGAVDALLAE